jgi:hypothetical protein
MYWLSRFLLCAACAVGTFISSLPATVIRAESENLAGHWHLYWYGRCSITVENQQACRDLQSPATFPAIGLPGAVLTVVGIGDYQADTRGHYAVKFTTTITERVAGLPAPRHCDDWLVFGREFNGTCREVGFGHGHIAPGRLRMPDFWQDDTTGSWNGHPGARFSVSGPTDTFNPACPGSYDTARFMKLFGYRTVPRGIVAHVVLTHTLPARR